MPESFVARGRTHRGGCRGGRRSQNKSLESAAVERMAFQFREHYVPRPQNITPKPGLTDCSWSIGQPCPLFRQSVTQTTTSQLFVVSTGVLRDRGRAHCGGCRHGSRSLDSKMLLYCASITSSEPETRAFRFRNPDFAGKSELLLTASLSPN